MKDREYPVSGFIVPLGNSKKKEGKGKIKSRPFNSSITMASHNQY
jgi:hypothetical protein